MSLYHFKTDGTHGVTEQCALVDCMIGSVKCQECRWNIRTSITANYVLCENIDEAIRKEVIK